MSLPTTLLPNTVAVTGGNVAAAENTEKEFVGVVVVIAVAAELEPNSFILLAGGGAFRASSWWSPGADRICLLSLEDAMIADVLCCIVVELLIRLVWYRRIDSEPKMNEVDFHSLQTRSSGLGF